MGSDVVGYVETRGPPVSDSAWVINPVISGLLRSPMHSLVSDSIMLLTFTGSKTGEEFTGAERIKTGQRIRIDGSRGIVEILDDERDD